MTLHHQCRLTVRPLIHWQCEYAACATQYPRPEIKANRQKYKPFSPIWVCVWVWVCVCESLSVKRTPEKWFLLRNDQLFMFNIDHNMTIYRHNIYVTSISSDEIKPIRLSDWFAACSFYACQCRNYLRFNYLLKSCRSHSQLDCHWAGVRIRSLNNDWRDVLWTDDRFEFRVRIDGANGCQCTMTMFMFIWIDWNGEARATSHPIISQLFYQNSSPKTLQFPFRKQLMFNWIIAWDESILVLWSDMVAAMRCYLKNAFGFLSVERWMGFELPPLNRRGRWPGTQWCL